MVAFYVDKIMLKKNTHVYLTLILSQLFWSGVFVAGQIAVSQQSAWTTTLVRNLLTTGGFLLVLVIQKKGKLTRPSRSAIKDLFWMGMFGVFLYNLLVYYGLEKTSAVSASLLIPTTQPIFTQLLAYYFSRESWSRIQIIGTVLGLIGASLIMTNAWALTSAGQALQGNFLILLASFTFSVYSIFGKRAIKELQPLEAVTYSNLVGSIIMLGMLFIFPISGTLLIDTNPAFWLSMCYLVIFASILPYLWWYDGIKQIGANKTAVITFLMPPFAIVAAAVVLGQRASAIQIIGAFISLFGVFLCMKIVKLSRFWSDDILGVENNVAK